MSLLSFQRKVIPKASTAVFKASFEKFSFSLELMIWTQLSTLRFATIRLE